MVQPMPPRLACIEGAGDGTTSGRRAVLAASSPAMRRAKRDCISSLRLNTSTGLRQRLRGYALGEMALAELWYAGRRVADAAQRGIWAALHRPHPGWSAPSTVLPAAVRRCGPGLPRAGPGWCRWSARTVKGLRKPGFQAVVHLPDVGLGRSSSARPIRCSASCSEQGGLLGQLNEQPLGGGGGRRAALDQQAPIRSSSALTRCEMAEGVTFSDCAARSKLPRGSPRQGAQLGMIDTHRIKLG